VYSSGAVVTRVAEFSPADGAWPERVRLAGLPLALDDSSIRIRMEGGSASAVSFQTSLEIPSDAPSPEAIEDTVRAARQEVLQLEDRLHDADRRAGLFAGLTPPARPDAAEGEAPPPSPHAGRVALFEFQQQNLKAIYETIEDLRAKLRIAREVLDSAQEKKRAAGTERTAHVNELRKTVTVVIHGEAAESTDRARLRLDYRVPGARWAPSYAVRFATDLSQVTITVRAIVAQRTGENWQNVLVLLSTAQMQAWTELPELASLRLGRWQAPVRSGWRPAPVGAEELYADYDREKSAIQPAAADPKVTALARRLESADEDEAPAALPPPPMRKPSDTPTGEFPQYPPPGQPIPAPPPSGEFTRMFQQPLPPPPPAPLAAPRPPAPTAAPAQFTAMFRRPGTAAPPAQTEGPAPVPPPPAEIRPALAALDFGSLRMPGPTDSVRARLTPAERTAGPEVLRSALDEAARLSRLPARYAFASSVAGFDYAYKAEIPVDIPADRQFHSIPLVSLAAPSHLYYVTVPRESSDVFRFAEIVNPLGAPLLPGPADIYMGNNFLMTVPLRLTTPKGKIHLGLGVEQRIKVARNIAYSETATGLMSGTLNLKHEIQIEVRNQLRIAAPVEVRERVPVTREGDDQLRVTTTAKPAWEPYDPPGVGLRGGYVWKVQVPPSEAINLQAIYIITLPAKMELAAGNRREA